MSFFQLSSCAITQRGISWTILSTMFGCLFMIVECGVLTAHSTTHDIYINERRRFLEISDKNCSILAKATRRDPEQLHSK
jgi:hypothetical protein